MRFVIALVVLIGLATAAHADCVSTSVCTRRVCRSEQRCTVRRVPVCHFSTRCQPVRSCVSRGGLTSCVTRDVCRREQICV
jgi:hypothetical protein